MSSSRFKVTGRLTVVESATVICLRNVGAHPRSLQRERFVPPVTHSAVESSIRDVDGAVERVFGGLDEIDLSSGWQVLMGQNECINWVKSESPEALSLMRYPGEYKFAGGNLDEGEDFIVAARRELEEEFLSPLGISLTSDAILRPFVFKQTLPVRSKSNVMWNMVALADENAWLQNLDIEDANRCLKERYNRFTDLLDSGRFWQLSSREREAVSPEVRELRWLPLSEALFLSLSTMVRGGKYFHVNSWQQSEFARLNVRSRDPMFMTACALMDVAAFPDAASIISYCKESFGDNACMASERDRLQYLFAGMTDEDVQKLLSSEPPEFVKDAPTVLKLRTARQAYGLQKQGDELRFPSARL